MKKKLITLLSLTLILASCSQNNNDGYELGEIKTSRESKSEVDVNDRVDDKNPLETKLQPDRTIETKNEVESEIEVESELETIEFEVEEPGLQMGEEVYSENAENEDLKEIGSLLTHLLQVDMASRKDFDKLINTLDTLNVEYDIKDFQPAWEYIPLNGDGIFASGTGFYEITDTHINVNVAPVVTPRGDGGSVSPRLRRTLRDYSRSGEAFERYGIQARFKYDKLDNGKYELQLENKWWENET